MSRVARFIPWNAIWASTGPLPLPDCERRCDNAVCWGKNVLPPGPAPAPQGRWAPAEDRPVRPGHLPQGDAHQTPSACWAPDLTRRWLQSPVPWVEGGPCCSRTSAKGAGPPWLWGFLVGKECRVQRRLSMFLALSALLAVSSLTNSLSFSSRTTHAALTKIIC